MSSLQPAKSGSLMGPGSAKTSLPSSAAKRAVISDPDFSAASMTKTPSARAAMRRLRRGK